MNKKRNEIKIPPLEKGAYLLLLSCLILTLIGALCLMFTYVFSDENERIMLYVSSFDNISSILSSLLLSFSGALIMDLDIKRAKKK